MTRHPLALALTGWLVLSACSLPFPSLKPTPTATPTQSQASMIRIFTSEDVIAAVTAVAGPSTFATTVPRFSGDAPPVIVPSECKILNDLGTRRRQPTGWQIAGAGRVGIAFKVMDRHFADALGDEFAMLASPKCSQIQLDGTHFTVTPNEQVKPLVHQGRSYGIHIQTSSSWADVSVWQGSNIVMWTNTNEDPSASPHATTSASAMNQVLTELGLT